MVITVISFMKTTAIIIHIFARQCCSSVSDDLKTFPKLFLMTFVVANIVNILKLCGWQHNNSCRNKIKFHLSRKQKCVGTIGECWSPASADVPTHSARIEDFCMATENEEM